MSDEPPETEAPLSPQLEAMHRAMRQAEEAAEKRRLAKLQAREEQDEDPELAMLAELALVNEPVDRNQKPTFVSYALGDENDLDLLIAEAAAQTPDAPGEERDGDLVIMRHENQAAPWYQEAAEAAARRPLDPTAQGHTATIRDVLWFDGLTNSATRALITGGEDSRLCLWTTQPGAAKAQQAAEQAGATSTHKITQHAAKGADLSSPSPPASVPPSPSSRSRPPAPTSTSKR